MEIDLPDENNGSTTGSKENGLHLYPVSQNDSGEGLPYAPEDFPNPGDKWSWKVGKRIAASGNFLDRYLYLPRHLHLEHKVGGFASKLSVQRFVSKEYPNADIDAFFASFSWKIPSRKIKCNEEAVTVFSVPISENVGCDSLVSSPACKAGNRKCSSLLEARDPPPSDIIACDICCSQDIFCRDCCCILCSRPVTSEYGGFSFIRCEATVEDGLICGHIGHIECGIRSYMAGTVGGSIGLDAEYYCRRCDARTDLVSYVSSLSQTCESIGSRDEIEQILNICVCILRGSSKISAKRLLHRIELAMSKLKNGTSLENIWKMGEDLPANTRSDPSQHEMETIKVSDFEEPQNYETAAPQILSGKFDYGIESLKLQDEVDQILLALRKSQESEYRIAEETLCAKKNHLLDLYQRLVEERGELAKPPPLADRNILLEVVLKRVDQIKHEVMKLKDMKAVANGFAKTPRGVLKEHFNVDFKED